MRDAWDDFQRDGMLYLDTHLERNDVVFGISRRKEDEEVDSPL